MRIFRITLVAALASAMAFGLPVLDVRSDRAAASPEPVAATAPSHVELLTSDPHVNPHAIARRLAGYVDGVPAGEQIRIETYYIGSSITAPALVAAHRRGVQVQVILNGSTREWYGAARWLAGVLNERSDDLSWLHWTKGPARGRKDSAIDHNKVWRFSRTGDLTHVTVVSSYNNTDLADRTTYGTALAVASPEVYGSFDRYFAQSRADHPVLPNPRAVENGLDWDAYWLPDTAPGITGDPAWLRLDRFPANTSTRLRIRMLAMFGDRGEALARKLASMSRRGVRIGMIAGPGVSRDVRSILRRAGVRVEGGCWMDGTYDHAKDYSATWMSNGRRNYWTFVGSDNWTVASTNSDNTSLGVAGRQVFYAFNRAFEDLAARADVRRSRCAAVLQSRP